MNNAFVSSRIQYPVMSATAGLAVFLFFVLVQPYHLRFQELYQMFLFSSDYFVRVASVPGGLADYLSRFLTQFMLFPWLGALIVSFLFVAVQVLTFKCMDRKCCLSHALSFIPAVFLAVYFCDKDSNLSVFTSAIIGLSAAGIFKKHIRQHLIAFLLIPALYFLCGSLGVVFFIAALHVSHKKALLTLCGISVLLVSAFVSKYIFNYPFFRLLGGIHYSRYHDSIPLLPWISAASALIVSTIPVKCRTVRPVLTVTGFIIVIAGLAGGLFAAKDSNWEEMFKYTTLVQESEWDKVIDSAISKEPSDPVSVSCLNLALAEKGQMGNAMFHFRQIGPDGLFYPYRREHISPLASAEIFWNLGFMNTSQRFTFAAQEVIPDYQKSSYCHKRLVEVYLVKGQYDLARKYLEPLKYTLFYRHWAKNTEVLLDNPELIDNHPVYKQKRDLDLKGHSSLFSNQDMYTPLYQYCLENPKDPVIWQYLLGLCLLDADLDRFVGYLKPEIFKQMPAIYQEAYILYWSRDHESQIGMPDFVTQKTISNFLSFNTAAMSMPEAVLKAKYSHTYWYYFITFDNGQN